MVIRYEDFWKSRQISPDQWHSCQVGTFRLWLKRAAFEWQYASSLLEENSSEACEIKCISDSHEPPSDVVVHRCIVDDDCSSVRFVPVMPDRPVVVRPSDPITLASGTSAKFFVSIPASLSMIAVGKREITVTELPTVELPGIWFGTFTEGILCYSLRSKARRNMAEMTVNYNRCIAPVNILNSSDSEVEFVSMCVQVDNLAIFLGQNHLWSNSIRFELKGEEAPNLLTYDDAPPQQEKIVRKLSQPRKPATQSIFNWELGSFKLRRNV